MDDFLGSVAQEDVEFSTEIVLTANPGDNYGHLVIYVENVRFIKDDTAFSDVKKAGTAVAKIAEVAAGNYGDIVKGQLATWLAKYFSAGTSNTVFVVAVCDKLANAEAFDTAGLDAAFSATHQLGYFKSVLICTDDAENTLLSSAAVELCKLCAADTLLSSAPLLPNYAGAEDSLYTTVKASGFDAFFSYKALETSAGEALYNPALVSLGIALSVINATGVYAGNAFDFVGNTAITASGKDGEALSLTEQSALKKLNIQYWKYVGDTTGQTVAYGAKTINGKHMSAYWLVAYCNYMCKVRCANYMAGRNVRVSLDSYNAIIAIMSNVVGAFQLAGIITDFVVTAPSYADRPASAADEIIIPNAWQAIFQDKLRKVKVTGQLTV